MRDLFKLRLPCLRSLPECLKGAIIDHQLSFIYMLSTLENNRTDLDNYGTGRYCEHNYS